MPETTRVASHYAHGGLLAAITAGLHAAGKSPETVRTEDLGPVDAFHIGGRAATEAFLDQVGLRAEDHVLDVGCGLGGAARFTAERYGSRVTGVDLTPEYVDTGNALSAWVGLAGRVFLEQGDATRTAFADGALDKAYMLHVGMNIADKPALAGELHRVLKTGGTLGVYDVMRIGEGDVIYPVPWATTGEGSAVDTPGAYQAALEAAGFRITAERSRRDFALAFFARLQAAASAAAGPRPLGLHILMGESAPAKIRNLIETIAENRVAPIEMIAEKPE